MYLYIVISHHPLTSQLIHLNISGSVFSSLALNPAGYSSLSNGYSGASYPAYNQPGYGCLGAYPGVPTSFSSMSPYTQDPLSMAGYGMSSLSSGTTIASPDSSLKPDVGWVQSFYYKSSTVKNLRWDRCARIKV